MFSAEPVPAWTPPSRRFYCEPIPVDRFRGLYDCHLSMVVAEGKHLNGISKRNQQLVVTTKTYHH